MSESLNAILVENNAYDRAVIDAALETVPAIKLHYTAKDTHPLELEESAWERCLGNSKPHLVLLDLALGSRCEQELPKASFQTYIRKGRKTLKDLIDQLEEEQDDMVPVVWASHFICEALTLGMPDGAAMLSRLSAMNPLSDEVRGRIQQVLTMLAAGQTPGTVEMDAALIALWRGKKALASLAKHLNRAPSLWRLLISIVNKPDVCFFVVSHYATEEMKEPLKDLLAARIRHPDPDFYAPFIINKSDLSNLGTRLVSGFWKWYELTALIPVTEPFAAYPVFHEKRWMRFSEVIKNWSKEHLAEKVTPQQTILWDESGTLDGGVERWQSIQKRWRSGLQVLQKSISSIRTSPRNILIIEPDTLKTPSDGASWATAANATLAARAKAKRETIVVVRGSRRANIAAMKVLSGVTCYRIPAFSDKDFSRVLSLTEMISNLQVTSEGDTFHVARWNDAPNSQESRALGRVLEALYVPSKALDRMVLHLEQPPAELTTLGELMARAESALHELKLTGGAEWKTIFDDAKLSARKRIMFRDS